ncbi:hypothetical protein BpHYR1_049754 [Brachionus plicatilis]|uniref:Uncharacterized protein n=1 Tax=Brachionus plicatilis TaxID=10195 RepID=A0A3M7Q5X3_BRAPC|nr:hypothetical protein BpHYR1_049754 [Brachionus plicatilis]
MKSLRVVLLLFLIAGLAIQIDGQCFEVETINGWACEDRGGKVGNCNRSGGRCNYHITKWCHVTMRGEKMVPCGIICFCSRQRGARSLANYFSNLE